MEITITIILIVALILVIQFFLWNSKKKDKERIDQDWQTFLKAVESSDISAIIDSGDKLIWNKHLKQNQLDKIIEVVDSKIDRNPELEKLKSNAFNKQLHYKRKLPFGGNPGRG